MANKPSVKVPDSLVKQIERDIRNNLETKLDTNWKKTAQETEDIVKYIIQKQIYDKAPRASNTPYQNTGAFKRSIYTTYENKDNQRSFVTKQLLPNVPPDAHYSWIPYSKNVYNDMTRDVPFYLDQGNNPNGGKAIVSYSARRWIKLAEQRARATVREQLKKLFG